MTGQLTLGLFEDIKPDNGAIAVITAAPRSELPGLYPPDFRPEVMETIRLRSFESV